MARSSAALKLVEDKPLDPAELLKRIFSENNTVESEEDFAILVNQALAGKDRKFQFAFNRALAVIFFNDGDRVVPKPLKAKSKAVALTEHERAAKAVERATKRLLQSQEAVALVEKRTLMRISGDCTFHDLWKLGAALGKKGDRRRVSEHCTRHQLDKLGIEVE